MDCGEMGGVDCDGGGGGGDGTEDRRDSLGLTLSLLLP